MSDLFDRIARNVEAAALAEMQRLKPIVQKRIGVPVQRTGGKTIRSRPGEPPRRDTGRLQASATAQTIDATRTVQGSVSVNTPYAKRLNNQMNRPIFGSILPDNRQAIRDAVRSAIVNTKG